MLARSKFITIAVLMLLVLAPAAHAALQVGPIDPLSVYPGGLGFPSYYMDPTGTAVALLPIKGDGVNPPTQIYSPLDNANPYSVYLGFDSEAFFYFARAVFSTKNGKATATFGLEASFVNGFATPGEEMVFARIRLKAPVRDVGTYTFQHPWGTETIAVTADDIAKKGGIVYTKDVGVVPGAFNLAANGPIQLFAKQLAPAPPPGWIGDGASVGTITAGSSGLDYVQLTGPVGIDLDGRKNNFVKSTQFTVSGRLVTQIPTALTVQRANCWTAPAPGQEYVDVFVTSNPLASIVLSGPSIVDPVSGLSVNLPMIGDGNGNFYIHAYSDEAKLAGLILPNGTTYVPGTPYPITLTASLTGAATTTITTNVTDVVYVSATYNVGTHLLTVQGASTDGADPTLTLKGYETTLPVIDPITEIRTWTIGPITVPPSTVTITSTMGGTDTDEVYIAP